MPILEFLINFSSVIKFILFFVKVIALIFDFVAFFVRFAATIKLFKFFCGKQARGSADELWLFLLESLENFKRKILE